MKPRIANGVHGATISFQRTLGWLWIWDLTVPAFFAASQAAASRSFWSAKARHAATVSKPLFGVHGSTRVPPQYVPTMPTGMPSALWISRAK